MNLSLIYPNVNTFIEKGSAYLLSKIGAL